MSTGITELIRIEPVNGIAMEQESDGGQKLDPAGLIINPVLEFLDSELTCTDDQKSGPQRNLKKDRYSLCFVVYH